MLSSISQLFALLLLVLSTILLLESAPKNESYVTELKGDIDRRQNMLNLICRVFQNSSESASIFGVPESLLLSLWELLKAVSSSDFQDIDKFKENAR